MFVHMTLCRLEYTGNHLKKSTFSSSVKTKDTYTVSLFHAEAYILQSPEFIVLDFSLNGFKYIIF